jgi:hypothetical protein
MPDYEQDYMDEGDEYFDPADPAELVMAAQGELGPQAKAGALDALGLELDAGYEDQGGPQGYQDDEAGLEQMADAIESQLQAVEGAIGRPLSQSEWRDMVKGISYEDLEQGVVPDLVSRHGDELKGRTESREYRIERGQEGAEKILNPEQQAEPGMFSDSSQGGDAGEGEGYEGEG